MRLTGADNERQNRQDHSTRTMSTHTALLTHLRSQFALDWHGIHGAAHWTRVRWNGLRLAEATGAVVAVVELFAFLHDARRLNDDHDPQHGQRAALLAGELNGRYFELAPDHLALLQAACRGHSDGHLQGEPTVLTCWDADRLDLGRVGIRPRAERLCTAAAREPDMLESAWRRSAG